MAVTGFTPGFPVMVAAVVCTLAGMPVVPVFFAAVAWFVAAVPVPVVPRPAAGAAVAAVLVAGFGAGVFAASEVLPPVLPVVAGFACDLPPLVESSVVSRDATRFGADTLPAAKAAPARAPVEMSPVAGFTSAVVLGAGRLPVVGAVADFLLVSTMSSMRIFPVPGLPASVRNSAVAGPVVLGPGVCGVVGSGFPGEVFGTLPTRVFGSFGFEAVVAGDSDGAGLTAGEGSGLLSGVFLMSPVFAGSVFTTVGGGSAFGCLPFFFPFGLSPSPEAAVDFFSEGSSECVSDFLAVSGVGVRVAAGFSFGVEGIEERVDEAVLLPVPEPPVWGFAVVPELGERCCAVPDEEEPAEEGRDVCGG